jgi:hypothetical protein
MSKELHLNYTLDFNRSRKDAFAYLKEVSNRKAFMTIIDETKITHNVKGDNLKGLRFKETTHFLGFDMHLEYEIVDFKKGHLIVTACNDGPFYPCMGITLTEVDDESCRGEVELKINTEALKLMPSFVLKPAVEAVVKPILKKLVHCINES